jgi:sugar transferase (PEP-CTERM/EpsH1 system associated)
MKILWLKTELLHPVDKGGKIRTYHLLKHLKTDHHVTYLTLDDGEAAPDASASAHEYCHELIRIPHLTRPKFSAGFYGELALNLASSLPYAIRKYKSEAMMRSIAESVSKDHFDVVICDFLAPGVNLPSDLLTPVVLFQHNVEAEIWRRHYEVQQNPAKRQYLYWQWRKMQRFERDVCRKVDSVIAVSEADAQMMERDYGVGKVYDIPTGVDVDFFQPSKGSSASPNSLVFIGSMDWLPNEDAMRYFIDDILPILRQRIPDVHVTIVGRNPYQSLLERAQPDPALTVTGRVDDVRPYIDDAVAFIVPIRIGGGTRLKIYEAMAMEKPVISTTVGAEGLPLHDGVHLLIADDPMAFADAIVKVLSNFELANELGQKAAQLVRKNFGWQGVAATFADLCQATIVKETSNPRT